MIPVPVLTWSVCVCVCVCVHVNVQVCAGDAGRECWGKESLNDALVSSTIASLISTLWLLTTEVCTECRNTRWREM